MLDQATDNRIMTGQQLKALLVEAHPGLSPQLQKIAQFVLDHPGQVAVSTIADLSNRLGVQPSSFIRFSKAIGFKGFSTIQRIVKAELQSEAPTNYFDRLQPRASNTSDTIALFARLGENSLQNLPSQDDIDAAASIMASAGAIHIIGHRRAFGIASYLNYMLGQFGARVNLLAFIGGMVEARSSLIAKGDCLVAITFPTYTATALETAAKARAKGARIVAITDSLVSPVAQYADKILLTDPGTASGFRSAVGATVTAQALAVKFGELTRQN